MRLLRLAWIVVALGLVAAAPAYADVQVVLQDGRVTITAKDATVAEILAEWARIADIKIVHADKLPLGRVTIELQNVTEREALDVLLRDVGGYIAHRRNGAAPGPSSIDYVLVMAPSAPVAPPPVNARAAAAATAVPTSYEPRAEDASPDADETPQAVAADQRAPTFTTLGPPAEVDDPATTEPMVVPMQLSQEEDEKAVVAQPAIRSRHALETVNPRNFVLPKTRNFVLPK